MRVEIFRMMDGISCSSILAVSGKKTLRSMGGSEAVKKRLAKSSKNSSFPEPKKCI